MFDVVKYQTTHDKQVLSGLIQTPKVKKFSDDSSKRRLNKSALTKWEKKMEFGTYFTWVHLKTKVTIILAKVSIGEDKMHFLC